MPDEEVEDMRSGIVVIGVIVVVAVLVYYFVFSGTHLGETVAPNDIKLNKRAFIGKTIVLGGKISMIQDQYQHGRIQVVLGMTYPVDFLIKSESLMTRFRAEKVSTGQYMYFKGKINSYSNSYDIYMDVEDFD